MLIAGPTQPTAGSNSSLARALLTMDSAAVIDGGSPHILMKGSVPYDDSARTLQSRAGLGRVRQVWSRGSLDIWEMGRVKKGRGVLYAYAW